MHGPTCILWISLTPFSSKHGATALKAKTALTLAESGAAADWNVSFAKPNGTAVIGVSVFGQATAYINFVDGASSALVGVYDGGMKLPSPPPDHSGKGAVKAEQLHLLPADEELTMRAFVDAGVLEVYCELALPALPMPPSFGAYCHCDQIRLVCDYIVGMDGRVVITSALRTGHRAAGGEVSVSSSVDCTLVSAVGWEMESIWVEPAQVLATARG
jgi:hypothetical protein